MQLQQLQYFLAVAETLHFTRAAEHVHVAQPSLSQQIRALETDLGTPLFHRANRNITLTEAGRTLVPIARRVLAETRNAYDAIRELDELGRGRVRLGATPSLCTGLLPAILAGFRDAYPGIELTIRESGSRGLQTELSEGTLDLALVIDSRPTEDDRLSTVPLLREELVLVSAPQLPPPAGGRPLSIRDLRDRPLVMFREGYDLRDATLAACRSAGFEPTFAVEGGEMDAVLSFVSAGIGLAVVPATMAGDRFRVTRFTTPKLNRTVHLAYRRDAEPTRAARALRDAITTHVHAESRSDRLPAGTMALPGRVRPSLRRNG
jgi:DNA-binding transcriptional LysR family regulator